MIQEKNNDALGVFFVFAFGVILHVVLFYTVMNFPRAIRIYPDEIRYYDIARSLFNGDGLTIRGLASDFQKIAYSLVLMPFFAISDVALRLRAIGLGNIFILNLSVIFAWLLASELGLSRRAKYFIAFFTAILPEMMLFITFMSEVLYWPLFLLFFWVWTVNERKESYFLAVVEGVICYVAYLTKEVFLAAILAYVAFEIVYPLIEGKAFQKNRIMRFGVFLASFAVCYLSVKLMFFRGMGNSYNQMGLQAIMSPYNFLFLLYSFFYYLAGILVAGLVIPFVYPFVNFRSMNEPSRKLYVFTILFMVITSFVLAYTISVRENLGNVRISVMLRYYGAAFLMLIMLLFSSLQNIDSATIRARRKDTLTALTFALMYICLMFRGFQVNNGSAHYWLMWYLAIDIKARMLMPPPLQIPAPEALRASALNIPYSPQKVIYLSVIIANLLLTAGVMIFHYVLMKRGTRSAKKLYASALVIMCLCINCAAYVTHKYSYEVDAEAVNEVVAISKYFGEDKDSDIMYLTHGEPVKRFDRMGRYIDTFVDRQHKLYVVDDEALTKDMKGNSLNVADAMLQGESFGIYRGVQKIDYIIIQNYDSHGMRSLANVEKVDNLSGKHYTVYRNLNPSELHFE